MSRGPQPSARVFDIKFRFIPPTTGGKIIYSLFSHVGRWRPEYWSNLDSNAIEMSLRVGVTHTLALPSIFRSLPGLN